MDASDRKAIKTLIDRRVRLLRADDPAPRLLQVRAVLPPTEAQLTVLRFAAIGLSTYQAAAILGRSRITVLTHQKAAIRRLGAHNVTHAVALAYRAGLLWPLPKPAPLTSAAAWELSMKRAA